MMTYSLGRGDRYIGAWDAAGTTGEMRDKWRVLIREEARSRGGMIMCRSSDPGKDETCHMAKSTPVFAQSLHDGVINAECPCNSYRDEGVLGFHYVRRQWRLETSK